MSTLTCLLKQLGKTLAGLLLLTVWAPSAMAAVNAVTGGIGGINNGTLSGGDGTGTARIELFASGFTLVKQARDVTGNVLPYNANVVSGQEIYFVLLVDNTTPFTANDLRISDHLNESEFTYVPNSIEMTAVPSGSDDAVLWSGSWSAASDTLGIPDDTASIEDTGGQPGKNRLTAGAVPGQANQTMNIPPTSILAIRFRVVVY